MRNAECRVRIVARGAGSLEGGTRRVEGDLKFGIPEREGRDDTEWGQKIENRR